MQSLCYTSCPLGTVHLVVFGPDRMAEWLSSETSEPRVPGSNPA